jgi:hypothetical protein
MDSGRLQGLRESYKREVKREDEIKERDSDERCGRVDARRENWTRKTEL